jgi:hypothetical protein
LLRKQSVLEGHGVTFSFTGIATGRHGFAVNPRALTFRRRSLVDGGSCRHFLPPRCRTRRASSGNRGRT